MSRSVLDFINATINKKFTYEEWCFIRRNGTQEEIEEAVERMMTQGGYDCLA